MVVLQQAAQPLAALDLASHLTDFLSRLDQCVAEPLMVPLGVKMDQVSVSGD